MSERIVDDLEVVEIDEQHGDLGPASRLARQRPFDVIAEEHAIGEPGQRIVEGVVEQLLLEVFLVGPVDEEAL